MQKRAWILTAIMTLLALVALRQALFGKGKRHEIKYPSMTWTVKEGRLVRRVP